MLKFVLVRMDLGAAQALVFAWKLNRFGHLLESQASDISQLLAASGAMVVYPMLTAGANCVAIWALQEEYESSIDYHKIIMDKTCSTNYHSSHPISLILF